MSVNLTLLSCRHELPVVFTYLRHSEWHELKCQVVSGCISLMISHVDHFLTNFSVSSGFFVNCFSKFLYSWNLFLWQRVQDYFLLHFFQFSVSVTILKSLIHMKLNFLQGVKYESVFILLNAAIQFNKHTLLKMLSFFHYVFNKYACS